MFSRRVISGVSTILRTAPTSSFLQRLTSDAVISKQPHTYLSLSTKASSADGK